MQAFLPSYLELSLASFTQQQERMRSQFTRPGDAGVGAFDAQIAQNLALFDRAMKMFSPFAFSQADEPAPAPKAEPPPPRRRRPHPAAQADGGMQAQIEKLAGKR
jgi:polyhydroxyalkanoate synthesis regulator protein